MTNTPQPRAEAFRVIWPEDIDWQPYAAFPTAARLAVLFGNPTEPGLCVLRVRVPAGLRMRPHSHSEDRVCTVITGIFYLGLGEQFDESRLKAHGPGSVIVLPGGQPHFEWAKSGECVTQFTAIGPLRLTYVNSGDDPRIL